MTVTTRTRTVGGGKLHFVHFTFDSNVAIVELLPARTNVRYSIESGIINQPSGSFWMLSHSHVFRINNITTGEKLYTTAAHGLTTGDAYTMIGRGTACTPSLASFGEIPLVVGSGGAFELDFSGGSVAITAAGSGGSIALNPEPIIGDLFGNIGMTALGVAGFTHYEVPAGVGATGKGLSVAVGTVGAFTSGSIWVAEEVVS